MEGHVYLPSQPNQASISSPWPLSLPTHLFINPHFLLRAIVFFKDSEKEEGCPLLRHCRRNERIKNFIINSALFSLPEKWRLVICIKRLLESL
jgi:hypothetical protein